MWVKLRMLRPETMTREWQHRGLGLAPATQPQASGPTHLQAPAASGPQGPPHKRWLPLHTGEQESILRGKDGVLQGQDNGDL